MYTLYPSICLTTPLLNICWWQKLGENPIRHNRASALTRGIFQECVQPDIVCVRLRGSAANKKWVNKVSLLRKKTSSAEVDYVIAKGASIVPIEVKAGFPCTWSGRYAVFWPIRSKLKVKSDGSEAAAPGN
jgi:hypothetical protein